MDRVYSNEERSFNDIREVGIAICDVGQNQRHIGILHWNEEAQRVLMLDLAWHHKLRNDEPSTRARYLWVDPGGIPEARLRQVAAMCRRIWKSSGKIIPYAFSHPNGCFDPENGRFLLGDSRYGLTCASFVLAVFHAAGLTLIDYSTWLSRKEDIDWQREIVATLRKKGASEEHVAAVCGEVGSARFRPEEVAGASTSADLPAEYPFCCSIGAELLRRMASRSSHPET